MINFLIIAMSLLHSSSYNTLEKKINSIEISYGKRLEINSLNPNVSSNIKKSRIALNNSMNNLNYILKSTNEESIFFYEESMHNEADQGMRRLITKGGADGIFYKNYVTKEKLIQLNLIGEVFLINLTNDKIDWEITKETKNIKGYICYKAISNITYYDKIINKKVVLKKLAWFTKEIPLSSGPVGIDGLPGLVLEATINGAIFFYVKELKLNKKVKIKKPSKGIKISKKEFDKLIEHKLKELLGN